MNGVLLNTSATLLKEPIKFLAEIRTQEYLHKSVSQKLQFHEMSHRSMFKDDFLNEL